MRVYSSELIFSSFGHGFPLSNECIYRQKQYINIVDHAFAEFLV